MISIDRQFLAHSVPVRPNDSHKGNYGHLLLVCGSLQMAGAAVLATGAALKSGCGLVTLHSCPCVCDVAVSSYPSAMLSLDASSDHFSTLPDKIRRFTAVAVGCGLGTAPDTAQALFALIDACRNARVPMVFDADALNILARHGEWLEKLPPGSIMTPHEGELKRLAGREASEAWPDENEKCRTAEWLSRLTLCIVVVKGYHTHVFTPSGEVFENTTGNPGMAKGGSGDVLTGLVGGLLAKTRNPLLAAQQGAWIHGYAGDCLTEECTAEAYSSRDLIDRLYLGFKEISVYSAAAGPAVDSFTGRWSETPPL